MAKNMITIQGARVHNLKNINIEIPREKMVVMTGLSGSGKSSLAFDTIYAEGQRRYMESLSSYARQFLGQMDKPDVDYIEGLSPAISIDQKTTSRNPRSTVGTVTEIYDYLRLLFARVGVPHCPQCGKPISQQTVEQMVDQLMSYPERTKVQILAPIARGKKGEFQKEFEMLKRNGYVRVRVDGEMRELEEEIKLTKSKKHHIEVVVDRVALKPGIESRLGESMEAALNLADGIVLADIIDGDTLTFSSNFACVDCGISIGEINPRMFSFNNPYGACAACDGLGSKMEVDPNLIVPDASLSINQGMILPWSKSGSVSNYYSQMLKAVCEKIGVDFDTPWQEMTEEQQQILLYGGKDIPLTFHYINLFGEEKSHTSLYEGVIPNLQRRYRDTTSDYAREEIESYMTENQCPVCKGKRLKPEVLAVKICGVNIAQVTDMTIQEAYDFFTQLALTERQLLIGQQILKEIKARLAFLVNVGLDYLTLSRAAGSLSGGEAQRIRLATQIGSGLVGVLYILDEPSIGLHQRDNARLIASLERLRDLGNTLIVVEHDEDTMYAADYIVDIGPGAGVHGGQVIAAGTLEEIKANPASITGQYLSGAKKIDIPAIRRQPGEKWLRIKGAAENNLKQIDAAIPLGVFTCVTGVSGSGKSSLINEILYKALTKHLYKNTKMRPGKYTAIEGLEYIDKVINIDQSPIGRTPRSNPATYTGVFDAIRELFAQTADAKMRGYKAGRFSFNIRGGRCEACSGDGIIKIEMHFLSDVYVPCEVCKGKRYNRETLDVHYKGKNIADVLDMTVNQAVAFFENLPKIYRKLKTLQDVGLGYIRLGQSATTLSGGEAQRVKLATELSRKSTGKTLYILDEPTTGLHIADIHKLLEVLNRLVAEGDSVLVIEHNLDVIKSADYILDLGPEGGKGGGQIIASGTPEEVVKVKKSYTGQFLKKILERG